MEYLNLMRIITKRAVLWTEMINASTILHTDDLDHHLSNGGAGPGNSFSRKDNIDVYSGGGDNVNDSLVHLLSPIVCQIGGRNARDCAEAAKIVKSYGYDEVNLNVGCPSNKVSGKHQFGAILMKQQDVTCDIISAMEDRVQGDDFSTFPVTVKTRVGIELDDGETHDSLEFLVDFIRKLRNASACSDTNTQVDHLYEHEAKENDSGPYMNAPTDTETTRTGCRKFYIHARKCILGGLTPAENRKIPPLNYPRVYELCRNFPDCEFVINGGIDGLQMAKSLCVGHSDDCSDTDDNGHYGDDDCGSQAKSLHHCVLQEGHGVPCAICNIPNGSCIAPPIQSEIPHNLVGCMLGRACMERPCSFWDTDRYFYGEASNPCRNRREVLEKYCQYLERTYPRRCCDLDERLTRRMPAPKVSRVTEGGCAVCSDVYGPMKIRMDHSDADTDKVGNIINQLEEEWKKVKISNTVIQRSLKPVNGVFYKMPRCKHFRQTIEKYSRDKKIRNCGPGYIIRKAMLVVSNETLDEDFVNTEDLHHHGW